MQSRTLDRLSRILVNVQPELSSVRTSEQLQAWADAVVELAATGLYPDEDTVLCLDRCTLDEHDTSCAAAAFGLRHWELALAEALQRQQATGELPSAADASALGAAFAALVYGGLLLGHASGSSAPLRAAMDIALGQVYAISRP